jgi:hypothetical protein
MKILSVESFLGPEGLRGLETARVRHSKAIVEMAEHYHSPNNLLKCTSSERLFFTGDVETVSEWRTDLDGITITELRYMAPFSRQFWYLLKRATLNNLRGIEGTIGRFLIVTFLMLIGLALYYDVQNDERVVAACGRVQSDAGQDWGAVFLDGACVPRVDSERYPRL